MVDHIYWEKKKKTEGKKKQKKKKNQTTVWTARVRKGGGMRPRGEDERKPCLETVGHIVIRSRKGKTSGKEGGEAFEGKVRMTGGKRIKQRKRHRKGRTYTRGSGKGELNADDAK